MKIEVSFVPASGSTEKQEVEIDASGASLEEVLKKAGTTVNARNYQYMVDGEPADRRTHVTSKSRIVVTERVRGS